MATQDWRNTKVFCGSKGHEQQTMEVSLNKGRTFYQCPCCANIVPTYIIEKALNYLDRVQAEADEADEIINLTHLRWRGTKNDKHYHFEVLRHNLATADRAQQFELSVLNERAINIDAK